MAELGASGSFCPAHVTLPVKAYFFSLSDDNAPSPYLVRFCLICVMLCYTLFQMMAYSINCTQFSASHPSVYTNYIS